MAKDSGHKWIVLVGVLFLTMTHMGLLLTFGTLFVSMMDKFKEARSVTATVQSLFLGLSLGPGVLSGILVTQFGVVKVSLAGSVLAPLGLVLSFFAKSIIFLDVCIGFISGLGVSFIYVSNTVVLGIVFNGSQKQLAVSLMYTVISIAGMVYPYVLEFLLLEYGLNGTFLILGAVFMNSFPVALLFTSDSVVSKYTTLKKRNTFPKSQPLLDNKHNGVHSKTTKKVDSNVFSRIIVFLSKLFTKPYVLVLLSTALMNSTMNGYNIVTIDIFVSKGYTVEDGFLSYVPASIASLVSRILPGMFKMKKGCNSLIFPIIYCLFGVVGQLAIYFSFNYTTMLVASSFNLVALGGGLSAAGVILVKIVEEEQLGIGFGLMTSTIGTLIVAIGPLYGTLRDITGSYDYVLLTTGLVHLTAAVMFAVTLIIRRNKSEQTVTKENTIYVSVESIDKIIMK